MSNPLEKAVEALLQSLAHPQVVHRLPGRLRIHLPILKKLAGEIRIDRGIFDQFAAGIRGLRSVDLSLRTGNVVLKYDEHLLSERQILDVLSKISRAAIRYRHRFEELESSQRPVIVDRLLEYFRNNGTAVVSAEQVELPSEIWS
jgi:hypothetical protein